MSHCCHPCLYVSPFLSPPPPPVTRTTPFISNTSPDYPLPHSSIIDPHPLPLPYPPPPYMPPFTTNILMPSPPTDPIPCPPDLNT